MFVSGATRKQIEFFERQAETNKKLKTTYTQSVVGDKTACGWYSCFKLILNL